jgi:uncharacterized membrane protein
MIFKKTIKDFIGTFWTGLSFLLPFAAIGYIFWKIIEFILYSEMGKNIGVEEYPTGSGMSVIILFVFLIGFLLRRRAFRRYLVNFESKLLFYVPGFKFYKALVNLGEDSDDKVLKPCLLKDEGIRKVCFLVESNEEWATLMIPEAPSFTTGEIVIVPLHKCCTCPTLR